MTMRKIVLAVFLLTLSGPVLTNAWSAGFEDCVAFVSSPDGEIQCVDGEGGVTNIISDEGFSPGDMTLGPDKLLYVTDPTNGKVVRLFCDPQDCGTFPNDDVEKQEIYDSMDDPECGSPQGPSFHQNDLYFNSDIGVCRLTGVADVPFDDSVDPPELVVSKTVTGEGTDFELNGELLFVDRAAGKVYGVAPPFSGTPALRIKYLSNPIGIAVDPEGVVYVAENGSRKIRRCVLPMSGSISASSCSVAKYFSSYEGAPYYIEHDFNGNLWVATENSYGKGTVWRFESGTTLTNPLQIKLKDFEDISPGAQGLAIPPTMTDCVSEDNTFPAGEQHTARFDCGSYFLKVSMTAEDECTMDVTARQVFPSDHNADLGDDFSNPLCVSDDYSNGLCAIFDDGDTCEGDKLISVFYSRFFELGGNYNDFPAVVRRDDNEDPWEEETISYVAGGVSPGDPGRTGGTKRSEVTLVDLEVSADVDPFEGFLPPMHKCPNCTFKVGSTVPVKFEITENGQTVTDAEPLISVQEVDTNEIVFPVPGNDDNVATLTGKQYHLNLKLLPPFEAGHTYRLTVIAAGYLGPKSILFKTK